MKDWLQERWVPLLLALAVAVAMSAATYLLEYSEGKRLAQMHRVEVLNQLNAVRARLEGGIQSRLVLARGLVAYVSTHPDINDAQFQELAKVLVAQQKGVHSVQLARDSIISNIYPPAGNEKAMGLNLLGRADERDAILRAITTRQTIIAGPVSLVQGGVAFISRVPVFVTDPGYESEGGRYWGLAQVVMSAQTLLTESGLDGESFPNLHFAMRGRDASGGAGALIFGDQSIFEADPVLAEVILPGGSWQIAAIPRGGWLAPRAGWISLVGSLLVIVSAVLAWMVGRAPARLKVLVDQATAEARSSEARLSELNQELEKRIEARTLALVQTNEVLLKEATDRRQVEQELRDKQAFYEALLKAQSDVDEGMLVIENGLIVFANEAMARLSGYSLDALYGKPYIDLVHPDQRAVLIDRHRRRLAGEQFENRYETSLITAVRERREAELAVALVKLNDTIKTVVVVRDITEHKALQESLQHMAHYDELTDLPNRALFFDRLERTLADARRYDKTFALLFVDLDGFKEVNDVHGHHAGDCLLREVARRMALCVRESDSVARVGGDEFTVILGEVTTDEDASAVALKIIDCLSTPVQLDTGECRIGASIGIARYPRDGENSESLLSQADSAMYLAKNKGRNSFCFAPG